MRTLLGISLIAVFAIAVMGCGTGLLPSMTAMHGGGDQCSTMFTDTFVISGKDLGFLQASLLLLATLLLPLFWLPSLFQKVSFQSSVTRVALKISHGLSQLHNLLLRLFSSGILHPQKYNARLILN